MATFASFLSPPPPRPPPLLPHRRSCSSPVLPFSPLRCANSPTKFRILRTLVLASSISSFNDLSSNSGNSRPKKSVLSSLIQEIEPLDVSLIQKDVPPTTVDAMKRTISGMLGLLPSGQFQVLIEALWEPLSKLLVSSMMTGYTLRNAEYRLSLERNLDIFDGSFEKQRKTDSDTEAQGALFNNERVSETSEESAWSKSEIKCENIDIQGLGELTPEAQKYILNLESRLSSVEKELCEVKRKTAALQMQQFVGEEKNDLLDYLRSLQPEKVAELSESTCPELKETIHSVVHGILATLSPKIHSKVPPPAENTGGTVNVGSDEDCVDLVENTSLQFQPLISLSRDYLARLLFWCMLLGHYLRGLEYRLELMKLLSLPSNGEQHGGCGGPGGEQVA